MSLGLQHSGGAKALWRLRDEGHPILEGWRPLSDHPRRGFVLTVPGDADPDRTVAWVVQAAILLSEMDLPTTWLAGLVYSR